MMSRTHMAFGLLISLILAPLISQDANLRLAFILIAVISSILPDIDHKGSKINNFFVMTKIIPAFFKHRGFFHSIWPALIGSLTLYFIATPLIAFAFAVGYLCHLLADSFTKQGVDWFYPALRIKGPMVTNSILETILFWIILALSGYLLFQ